MEFLLILSALLSAVTGAFTGPREANAPARQEASVERVELAQASVSVAASTRQIRVAAPGEYGIQPLVALVEAAPVSRSFRVTDRLME